MASTVPPPRPRRRLRRWAVGVSVGYLAVGIGLWGWMVLAGDADVWPTLLLFSPRWLILLPLLVAVPLAFSARSWRAVVVISIAAVVALGPFMGGRVNPGRWADPPPAHATLRVLTWNAAGKVPNQEFQQFVRDVQPDLIVTQESPHEAILADQTRGWTAADGGSAVRLLSRHPAVLDKSIGWKELGTGGGAADFRVTTPHGAVRVYGVHLPTPRDGIEKALHSRFADLSALREVIAGRDAASAQVRGWVGDSDRPTVVAGDFNTPVESAVYRRDWGGFTNAFSAAGNGWGGTKFTRWHSARIDHILTSSHLHVRTAVVGPESGSDHRPVFAELELVSE